MPNALNDKLLELQRTAITKGLISLSEDEILLLLTKPVVYRDEDSEETGTVTYEEVSIGQNCKGRIL